jgi:hypothetical protein
VRVNTRPDKLDLEALDDLGRHPGFAIYTAHLREVYADLLRQLKSAATWEDTLRIQGQIRQVELVLEQPKVIGDKIRKRLAKDAAE